MCAKSILFISELYIQWEKLEFLQKLRLSYVGVASCREASKHYGISWTGEYQCFHVLCLFMINKIRKIQQDSLVVYWIKVLQYFRIRTQQHGFVKQDFTYGNDPWFSNEDPLKIDILLNLKHACATPPGRTSCNKCVRIGSLCFQKGPQ